LAQPKAGSLLDHVLILFWLGQAEQLALLLLKLGLFLHDADFVIGKLLQPGGLLLGTEVKVIGYVLDFLGQLAEDFFIAADGLLEYAYSP